MRTILILTLLLQACAVAQLDQPAPLDDQTADPRPISNGDVLIPTAPQPAICTASLLVQPMVASTNLWIRVGGVVSVSTQDESIFQIEPATDAAGKSVALLLTYDGTACHATLLVQPATSPLMQVIGNDVEVAAGAGAVMSTIEPATNDIGDGVYLYVESNQP